MARFYLKHIIPLTKEENLVEDCINQVSCKQPTSYISISLGKFSIADFFDNNKYAHDPRSQFMNWALMSNGAWDYPANTRGYTWGFVGELIRPKWSLRVSSTLMPTKANGNQMNLNIKKSKSEAIEFQKNYSIRNKPGTIRLLAFFTQANMGNYRLAINSYEVHRDTIIPDITTTRHEGRIKYGWGINIEQQLTELTGFFARASWNDGRNETWAFTEIDRSVSAGLVFNGKKWKREDDNLGIAAVINGISKDHRDYLRNGGHGFMIGDGKLDYGNEIIGEVFYNFHLHDKSFWISPDYQFVLNPAYNINRGPVHVFSVRLHVEF